jgi:hypothetical protein
LVTRDSAPSRTFARTASPDGRGRFFVAPKIQWRGARGVHSSKALSDDVGVAEFPCRLQTLWAPHRINTPGDGADIADFLGGEPVGSGV